MAGESEVLGENLPLCPAQIPLDHTRARTRTPAVGSQRLTDLSYDAAQAYLHFSPDADLCPSSNSFMLITIMGTFVVTYMTKERLFSSIF
jgi:hypothetical protein